MLTGIGLLDTATTDLGGTAGVVRVLPIACTSATLGATTLGTPGATASYQFTLHRAPGPNPSAGGMSATTLSCTLNSTTRQCTTTAAVSFAAGDAVSMVYVQNATIASQAPDGGMGVYFRCN